ncbi:3-hydroxybutyryl-CoA dehydrogenase [Maritimibacter sp. DP07]|uniref:3-hydroxybutyryl-CoA dehydrogenase n=1 Tax=Maritimibacter harenae TaxID=2606218 RepID=A0A845LWL7_9RHOB|nr:3-hydroxyacyl-CoA dehydrogenase family protein [Maritimibacter harenae]MZR12185.1 3-hydroxybutyryl-CoA dehydrogenase [Maritimibacter harenae]
MPTDASWNPRESVAVVGGGTMGVGIAYVFTMSGYDVHLVEPDADRRQAAFVTMGSAARTAVERGKIAADLARDRVSAVSVKAAVEELPEGVDLAIETVPEQRVLKEKVLSQISERAPALIASNTSALSIDDLSGAVETPSTFLGMHFFNPVWSLMLVEIVRGSLTSDASIAKAQGFAEGIGKKSAVVSDVPGFATSRLDLVQALEAIRMVENGVASPEDIDRAIETAYRHPMGPLRLSDVVGLDVRLDIARHLEDVLGPHFAPPKLLQDMVARGELGRKSGKGFYEWPETAQTQ